MSHKEFVDGMRYAFLLCARKSLYFDPGCGKPPMAFNPAQVKAVSDELSAMGRQSQKGPRQ